MISTLAFLFSAPALAAAVDWGSLLGGRNDHGCPPYVASMQNSSEFNGLSAPCREALTAQHRAERSATTDERISWTVKAQAALLKAPDARQTALIGLRFLNTYRDVPPEKTEGLRLMNVRAVALAARLLGTEYDDGFLRFGLEISDSADGSAQWLSARGFLRDYPQSKNAREVREIQATLTDVFLTRELGIGAELEKRGQFFGALSRYEQLYAYDFVRSSPRLSELLYRVIANELAFADEIAEQPDWFSKSPWTDQRLRNVFRLKDGQAVDRSALGAQLIGKARKTLAAMKKLALRDEMTARAAALLASR